MAYGYWKTGNYNQRAVFHLYFRKSPFGSHFAIAAGLQQAVEYLENLHFETEEIQYLASLRGADKRPLFDESFLNKLQRFKFDCDVWAMPEGTVVFPNEPMMRIEGPLWQAQLVETALLNILNFQTLIATKAARVVAAAKGDSVIEFGLRRAQGTDGALTASRAAYIGGCIGTSNVLAGYKFGIPIRGTHAHAWVMSFDDEQASFEAYAAAMPNNCIFLVDTYNTIEGIKKAIAVGQNLRENGHKLLGLRLDSGDLCALSIAARKLLDDANMHDTNIVASNDLDEYEITRLKEAGAKINIWGVGTKLVTSYDQPALGGVYKLAALQDKNGHWQYKVKRSEDLVKTSLPGIQQVVRFFEKTNTAFPSSDLIINTPIDEHFQTNVLDNTPHELLLQAIFKKGKRVYDIPTIAEIRTKTSKNHAIFSPLPHYKVEIDPVLTELRQKLLLC
jgi:nicotinate phosphoribosyltransferase